MRKPVFTIMFAAVLAILAITPVFAGDLEQAALPSSAGGGAMYTLEDIYNRLLNGAAGTKRVGPFVKPDAGPGATGHTLNDVMDMAPVADNTNGAVPADVLTGKTFWGLNTGKWGLQTGSGSVETVPAPVRKTGQTIQYAAGDDGALQKGMASSTPRFTDNGNGTVTDNLTGLIWLKNANCWGAITWAAALTNANGLANGSCSLTDGSTAGQWRLPNRFELESLLDLGNLNPALPADYPFSNVQYTLYWSATSSITQPYAAWRVYLSTGLVTTASKTDLIYVLPVRGGQ